MLGRSRGLLDDWVLVLQKLERSGNRLVLLDILYTSGVGRLGGCWLKPLAKLAVIGTVGRKPSGHVG